MQKMWLVMVAVAAAAMVRGESVASARIDADTGVYHVQLSVSRVNTHDEAKKYTHLGYMTRDTEYTWFRVTEDARRRDALASTVCDAPTNTSRIVFDDDTLVDARRRSSYRLRCVKAADETLNVATASSPVWRVYPRATFASDAVYFGGGDNAQNPWRRDTAHALHVTCDDAYDEHMCRVRERVRRVSLGNARIVAQDATLVVHMLDDTLRVPRAVYTAYAEALTHHETPHLPWLLHVDGGGWPLRVPGEHMYRGRASTLHVDEHHRWTYASRVRALEQSHVLHAHDYDNETLFVGASLLMKNGAHAVTRDTFANTLAVHRASTAADPPRVYFTLAEDVAFVFVLAYYVSRKVATSDNVVRAALRLLPTGRVGTLVDDVQRLRVALSTPGRARRAAEAAWVASDIASALTLVTLALYLSVEMPRGGDAFFRFATRFTVYVALAVYGVSLALLEVVRRRRWRRVLRPVHRWHRVSLAVHDSALVLLAASTLQMLATRVRNERGFNLSAVFIAVFLVLETATSLYAYGFGVVVSRRAQRSTAYHALNVTLLAASVTGSVNVCVSVLHPALEHSTLMTMAVVTALVCAVAPRITGNVIQRQLRAQIA